MTDKEIIKALECCYRKDNPCRDCPFNEFEDCNDVLMADYVFNLIKRQQAETDILKADLKRVCAERDARICTNNFIKSEAVKEFAERLEEKSFQSFGNYGITRDVVEVCDIDNLVKEMVGDKE